MTVPDCPRCSQLDQVQSAQSIYAAQTGVTDSRSATVGAVIGAGPVIAGIRSHGTHTSNLARQLAPPATPRRISALNCGIIGLIVVFSGVVLVGIDGIRPANPPSDRHIGEAVSAVGIALLAILLLAIFAHSRNLQRRYEASRAIWPAYMHVWQNAMVCLRCYVAFFPAGALPPGLDPGAPIPVSFFRSAVTELGARLADADPGRYTQT